MWHKSAGRGELPPALANGGMMLRLACGGRGAAATRVSSARGVRAREEGNCCSGGCCVVRRGTTARGRENEDAAAGRRRSRARGGEERAGRGTARRLLCCAPYRRLSNNTDALIISKLWANTFGTNSALSPRDARKKQSVVGGGELLLSAVASTQSRQRCLLLARLLVPRFFRKIQDRCKIGSLPPTPIITLHRGSLSSIDVPRK